MKLLFLPLLAALLGDPAFAQDGAPTGAQAGAPNGAPDGAVIFKEADLALGQRLLKEKNCAACHARQFGGYGSGVFRPMERIKTAGQLRGMVEQCNTNLNLAMFPEDVTAVSAVLNRDHYRFK